MTVNCLKDVWTEKKMTNKRLAELVCKAPTMVSKCVMNVAKPNEVFLILIPKLL